MAKEETSWGKEASWYDAHLLGADTYHEKVILPNLLRVLGSLKGKKVIELGCGQGYFSCILAKEGAEVMATDISKELIDIAKKNNKGALNPQYEALSADRLSGISSGFYDIAVVVLALQNIKDLGKTIAECKRILTSGGKLVFVLNHPCFRIPQASSWGFDDEAKSQYRRRRKLLGVASR